MDVTKSEEALTGSSGCFLLAALNPLVELGRVVDRVVLAVVLHVFRGARQQPEQETPHLQGWTWHHVQIDFDFS